MGDFCDPLFSTPPCPNMSLQMQCRPCRLASSLPLRGSPPPHSHVSAMPPRPLEAISIAWRPMFHVCLKALQSLFPPIGSSPPSLFPKAFSDSVTPAPARQSQSHHALPTSAPLTVNPRCLSICPDLTLCSRAAQVPLPEVPLSHGPLNVSLLSPPITKVRTHTLR